jgi:hypothetical protein
VHAPTIADEDPVDGATEVLDTITQISFVLADYDADYLTYTVGTDPAIITGSHTGG